jgi:PadR family transcriptional regulator PadR
MEPQLKKGVLDIFVLYTISKDDTYGYKIIQDMMPYVELPESTLYTILRRLEEQLLVKTLCKEAGGRTRKYYSITTLGKSKLDVMKNELVNLKNIIEYILDEGEDR